MYEIKPLLLLVTRINSSQGCNLRIYGNRLIIEGHYFYATFISFDSVATQLATKTQWNRKPETDNCASEIFLFLFLIFMGQCTKI